MGMMRDREAELSGLRLLLSRLEEPTRRAELSATEWNTAFSAWALENAGAEIPSQEAEKLYAAYRDAVPPEMRAQSLARLAAFISTRRGTGWQSLLYFVLGEQDNASLCSRAAYLVATLAPADDKQRFAGVRTVVQLLLDHEATPPAALDGLLAPADLRLLPDVEPLHALPEARLLLLLRGLDGTLNSLSSAWLLSLAQKPALREELTSALLRLASRTSLVLDVVHPIPSWAFQSSAAQPLHAWSRADFFPRILPALTGVLLDSQITRLRQAFT